MARRVEAHWYCVIERTWETLEAWGAKQAEREHVHAAATNYMAEVEAVPQAAQWNLALGIRPGPGNGRVIDGHHVDGKWVAATVVDHWRVWWIIRHAGNYRGRARAGGPWQHYHYRLAHSNDGLIQGSRLWVRGKIEILREDGDFDKARDPLGVVGRREWSANLLSVPSVTCRSGGYK